MDMYPRPLIGTEVLLEHRIIKPIEEDKVIEVRGGRQDPRTVSLGVSFLLARGKATGGHGQEGAEGGTHICDRW